MENKKFKMNEEVFFFNNRVDEPRIIEGIIVGAIKQDGGIYDFIYVVEGKHESVKTYRLPYQLYKSLEELQKDILDYAVLPNISK